MSERLFKMQMAEKRVRIVVMVFGGCVALAGCSIGPLIPSEPPVMADDQLRPQARPDGAVAATRPPPETARTVEEFDTTTPEERQAAAAPEPDDTRLLGTTIVSLGDPARPGFWIETPLVSSGATGRVVFPETGQASQVDLIPIDGPTTAGSRMSLAAMRLIGAPLSGLVEVQVFSGG